MKKKTILISKLTWVSVVVALLSRLHGKNVYYITASPCFRLDWVYELLKYFEINALNYSQLKEINVFEYTRISGILSVRIVDTLLTEKCLAIFAKQYENISCPETKLRIYLVNFVRSYLDNFCHVQATANFLSRENREVELFFAPNFLEAFALGLPGSPYVNRCPEFFKFIILGRYAIRIGIRVAAKICQFIFEWRGFKKKIVLSSNTAAINLPQVLFFPHQGVLYGNLYAKDQYYSNDPGSPFNQKNMLHVEVSFNDASIQREVETYYNQNDLPYVILKRSITSFTVGVLLFFKFIIKNSVDIRQCLTFQRSISSLALLFVNYISYASYRSALRPYSGAKIALIGYEFIFQSEIYLALQSYGIKVVACQERFVTVFFTTYSVILDNYLVVSKYIEEHLQKSKLCLVDSYSVVGFPRSDILVEYEKQQNSSRLENLKKTNFLVTVLDYHSATNRYEDFLGSIPNWQCNKFFYLDIINLAVEYPGAYFIIRGKNDYWCDIPYFEDILRIIELMPNIEINRDYSKLNVSYELCAHSDAIIAKATSIGDECLAVGKSVIFHDYIPNDPACFLNLFNYESLGVFVHNYQSLHDKFASLMAGDNFLATPAAKQKLEILFGNLNDGGVRKRIQAELLSILERC